MKPGQKLDEPLIGTTQAAELIGFSVHTLRKWAWQRKIRSYMVGGELRFKKSDLEAFVIEREKAL